MDKKEAFKSILGLDIKDESPESLAKLFQHFRELKKFMEDFEKKELKPILFKTAETKGVQNEKGSFAVITEDGYGWEKQARTKVTVDNERAVELMEEKVLTEYIDVEETIAEEDMEKVIKLLRAVGRGDLITENKVVQDSYLEQAYLNGQITDEEFKNLIEVKTTYALVEVKPKKK